MKYTHFKTSNAQWGSTVVEYSMIAFLVLAVSLVGVSGVGNNLSQLLTKFKTEISSHGSNKTVVAVSATSNVNPSASLPSSASSSTATTIATEQTAQQQSVCFKEGVCVTIPVVNTSNTASTAGVLGGQLTHEFASVFEQIALQLSQEPKADNRLVSLITQLANGGHTIADSQQSLLSLCQPGAACNSTTSVLQTKNAPSQKATANQATPVQQYLQEIGNNTLSFQDQYTQLQSYLATHPDALSSSLQQLIATEVTQINTIASAYPTGSTQDSGQNVSVSQSTKKNNKKVTLLDDTTTWQLTGDPVLIHQDANTICGSGGDTSQCTQSG